MGLSDAQKKWVKRGAIALVGVLVLYIGVRIWAAIPTFDSKKMGEYIAAKVAAEKISKELTAKNALLTADIVAKDKLLNAKQADIDRKNAVVAVLGKKQADLEAQFTLIKDCPSQVVNLTAQVGDLKGIIEVKDGVISDLGDKIVLLTLQKKDALDGWENEKKMRGACLDQAAACDAVQKQLARDLKICKLERGVTIVVAVAVVAAKIFKVI